MYSLLNEYTWNKYTCHCGGIGIHKELRIPRKNPCEFESRQWHQYSLPMLYKANWHSRYRAYLTIRECSVIPALATLAQMVEHLTFNQRVGGSSPLSCTKSVTVADNDNGSSISWLQITNWFVKAGE